MNYKTTLPLIALIALLLAPGTSLDARAYSNAQDDPMLTPEVIYPVQRRLSPPLSSLAIADQGGDVPETVPVRLLPKAESLSAQPLAEDPVLQTVTSVDSMPATGFNFEGVPKRNNVLPPDTNGDVGLNHYVQWVNLSLRIWQLDRDQKIATPVYGPVDGNTLWSALGGACGTYNDGDPIVLYDHLADRWFLSQFAVSEGGPYYQCIAVSQTSDPLGGYFLYQFEYDDIKMNDYPHFGVWPDGYYMTVNQFNYGSSWGGAGVAVFERDKMLQGLSPRMVKFDLYGANPNFGGMLPSDLDGTPPPAGTPNYFAEADDSSWLGSQDAIRIWEFRVNWNDPLLSTFGNNGQPNQVIPIANFNPMTARVPQPGTAQTLDTLYERLMYRLQFRDFGTHATMVTNHTVDAGGPRAGVRWYELRRSAGGWFIQQQATYAGDGDTIHRWMGSAAMDRIGNLALGFSRSSGSLFPGISYAGRLNTDPPNTMAQGEAVLQAGNGSQTHSSGRWGDYSMLGVDPVDDCTFWYTSEFYSSTSNSSWRTRVGSFTFPSCLGEGDGVLEGTVTSGGSPLDGARVDADGYSTLTGPDGFYNFPALPVGTYTVTASLYGYQPATFTGIEVFYNTTTLQDFSLAQLPLANVHGTVRDGSGQVWPLYARINISADGFSQSLFSDPVSGAYQISLPEGVAHSFEVSGLVPGYLPQTVPLTPLAPDTLRDFTLLVDGAACTAPGYLLGGTCDPQPGGLLVGNVYDAGTSAAINAATVASDSQPGDSTLTFATPDDPGQDDGLYILFSSFTGTRSFTASKLDYGSVSDSANVPSGGIASLSFYLPSGRLEANPQNVFRSLLPGEVVTVTVVLSNTGGSDADFNITEVDGPMQALVSTGPFASATRHTSPKRLGDLDAQGVYEYIPPTANLLPGGQMLRSWQSALAHPWGIGYDTKTDSLWIGDVAIAGGDDQLHRFDPNGLSASDTIESTPDDAIFAASLAFNPFTGNFWQVSVASEACIFEVDPLAQSLTGKNICPPFAHSQRGLAFDPLSGSYYSGSWTNGILYHFTASGVILDSINLNLNISGLAFNPATAHLFVLSNAAAGYDVYVLDVERGYAIVGGFDIPGLGDFEQAGMSMDCAGHLWVVNQQTGMVFEVDSGESSACTYADIPWLVATPTSGNLAQGASQNLLLRLDAGAAQIGNSQGSLVITSNTPYDPLIIPVSLNMGYFFNLPLISSR